jgi:hypothetical protein
MSALRSMTRYTVDTSRPGRTRTIAISLPLIPQLLDLPAYTAPVEAPNYTLPEERRRPPFSAHTIRRPLGRDREAIKRLTEAADKLKFEATLRRISDVGW